MKKFISLSLLSILLSCLLNSVNGGATNATLRIQKAQGIDVSLYHVGGVTLIDVPDLAGAVNEMDYDDGYVKRDSFNSGLGRTWNWGYENDAQISNNSVNYSLGTTITGNGPIHLDNQKDIGFGIYLDTPIQLDNGLPLILTYGLNVVPVEARTNQNLILGSRTLKDSYSLLTSTVPPAPHSGSANFPGAMIGLTPTRSFAMDDSTHLLEGVSEVDGRLLQFSIGGKLVHEIASGLNLTAEAAVLANHARIEFSSDYEISRDGGSVGSISESSTTRTTTLGFSAGIGLSYTLTENLAAYFGYHRIFSKDFSLSLESGARAKVDMGDAYLLAYGVHYLF